MNVPKVVITANPIAPEPRITALIPTTAMNTVSAIAPYDGYLRISNPR